MIVYHYDTEKLLTGDSIAQENPVRDASYLIPANSTTVEPMTEYTGDEIPKYDVVAGTWSLIPSQSKIDADALEEKEAQEAADLLATENAEKLAEVNEHGVLLYDNVDGTAVARTATAILEETNVIVLELQLVGLKDTLDAAILEQAMTVTKGTGVDSVTAFIQAYQLRSLNPSLYLESDLMVRYPTEGFVVGDLLDTELKITTHYNAVMIELDLFREAKIAEYLIQKNAIESI